MRAQEDASEVMLDMVELYVMSVEEDDCCFPRLLLELSRRKEDVRVRDWSFPSSISNP